MQQKQGETQRRQWSLSAENGCNTEALLNGCTKHFKRNELVNVRRFLVDNCPAGLHSTENRTCILCPLGTYQPSHDHKDCLSCGQGLAMTSTGATSQSQCTFLSQSNYKIYSIFEELADKERHCGSIFVLVVELRLNRAHPEV